MSFSIKKHPVGSKVFIRIGEGLCWVGEVDAATEQQVRLVKVSCVVNVTAGPGPHAWEDLCEPVTGQQVQPQDADIHSPLCIASQGSVTLCRTYEGELPFDAAGVTTSQADTNCTIMFPSNVDHKRWVAVSQLGCRYVSEVQANKNPNGPVGVWLQEPAPELNEPAFVAHFLADLKKP